MSDLSKRLCDLADKFSEGWHDGIKIDATEIELLADAAAALEPEQAEQSMGNSHESNTGESHITEYHQKEAFESPENRVFEQDEMPSGSNCKWPACQTEEYQQMLCKEVAQSLGIDEQEPVVFGWAIQHSNGTNAYVRFSVVDFFGEIQKREPFTPSDLVVADREWPGLAPHTLVTLCAAPPRREPLTPEEMFTGQMQFLEWNRSQPEPPIKDSVEMWVFQNAMRIAHGIGGKE